jgi:hypothetical protein
LIACRSGTDDDGENQQAGRGCGQAEEPHAAGGQQQPGAAAARRQRRHWDRQGDDRKPAHGK